MSGPASPLRVLLVGGAGAAGELRSRGAEVAVFEPRRFVPTGATADPADYDWIVYTSPRAVAYSPFPPAAGPRVACVGPGTARAAEERGAAVAVMPERHDGAHLAAALVARGVAGARVLLPAADRAGDELADRLAEAGARVTRLATYRTEIAPEAPPPAGPFDVVVFFAPSAVEGFVAAGGDLFAAPALAIGETTAAALAERGAMPEIAPAASRDGVIEALFHRERRR